MLRTPSILLAVTLILAAHVLAAPATSSALEIGDKAPNFTAQGVDGKEYSLDTLDKKHDLVIVCFTCNQCPVAVAYEDRLIEFNKQYQDKDIKFLAVNSNNRTEDLEAMKRRAEKKDFNFTYAFDASGQAAKDYKARVTPELFIVKDGKIAYHGAFDDSQGNPKESYLVNAVDALLSGETPKVAQTRPFGCSIKLK